MNMSSQSPDQSLATQIYQTIRRAIILGEYPAGMRLNEIRMAEELHVSRVPVREALPLLEKDGFIIMRPHRSAIVCGWDRKRVNDLFDARLAVEVAAVGYAAARAGSLEHSQAVQSLLDYEQSLLDADDCFEISQNSAYLHLRIVELSGNQLMSKLMGQITESMVWLFYLTAQRNQKQQYQEHLHIYEAIKSGNVRFAESVAYEHVESGRLPTLEKLNL